eukprot:scaffold770_cov255-Pinguiococcus_pyrenoidosus.AAC.59
MPLTSVVTTEQQREAFHVCLAIPDLAAFGDELIHLRRPRAHEEPPFHEATLREDVDGADGARAVGEGTGGTVARSVPLRLTVPADAEAVLAAGHDASRGFGLAHRIDSFVDAMSLHDLHEVPSRTEAIQLPGGASHDGVHVHKPERQERLHLPQAAQYPTPALQGSTGELEELHAPLAGGDDVSVVGMEGDGEQLRLVPLPRGQEPGFAPLVNCDRVVLVESHADGLCAVSVERNQAHAVGVEARDVGFALQRVRVPNLDARSLAELPTRHQARLRVDADAQDVVRVTRIEVLRVALGVVHDRQRRRGEHHQRLDLLAQAASGLDLRLRRSDVPHVVPAVVGAETMHPLELKVRIRRPCGVWARDEVGGLQIAEALGHRVGRLKGSICFRGGVGAIMLATSPEPRLPRPDADIAL